MIKVLDFSHLKQRYEEAKVIYQEAGIGIALDLQSTGQNRRFINDIPPHLGHPIEPEDFHVTTLYPEELARSGLSTEEREKLPEVTSKILCALGDLSIIGREMSIVRNVLQPYKKFLGIEIDPAESLCDEIREVVTPIIFDNLGIKLPDFLPKGYHASVAFRQGGTRRGVSYHRHFPHALQVTGISVGVRKVMYTNDGQPLNYVNGCFRNRANATTFLGRAVS